MPLRLRLAALALLALRVRLALLAQQVRPVQLELQAHRESKGTQATLDLRVPLALLAPLVLLDRKALRG
jgi:hypothetical protein